MMSAPQGGTPAAVVNQPPAAPPTPSPDGTIGESSAGTQQSAALSAAPVAPAAAGTTAAGTTAVAVGAGVGKRKQTSSIWRFMQLFVPPDSKGRNVKCIVKIKLPTSVGDVLPARTKTCGALFKHTKGDLIFLSNRWGSQHAMLGRQLRLYKAIQQYFMQNLGNRTVSNRALNPTDWLAVQQVVSVLDEAAQLNAQVQGGHHAFVGKAINDFAVLTELLNEDTQEIRSMDPYDGPRVDVLVHDHLPEVQTLLEVLVEDMNTRGLGRATGKVEKICLVLDPRYKSYCEAVCLNGGQQLLRESVTALVEGKLSSFTGSVASGGSAGADASSSGGPGASVSGSGGSGAGANSSGRDNGAGSPEAAGTGAASRAGGAGSPAPTAPISRMDRRKAQRDKKVARPPGDVDAPESRADVAEREFNAYMKEAAPSNSSDFDLLQYWATRSVDGIDPSGKVVVPARWPHIGLLARLYAGVDITSCQAERNFSALKHTLPHKVEKMLLLRLNRHLIPGFAEVVRQLEALKAKCDVHAAVISVAAQNAREGDFVHVA